MSIENSELLRMYVTKLGLPTNKDPTDVNMI